MTISLKALLCTQCGASIGSDTLKCSSCGTQFMLDWTASVVELRPASGSETSLLSQLGRERDRVVDALLLSLFQNAFQRIGWESEPAWNAVSREIVFKVRHANGPWLDLVEIEMYPDSCKVCVRAPSVAGSWDHFERQFVYGHLTWQTGLLLGQRFYDIGVSSFAGNSYRGETELMASPEIASLARTATDFCLSTLPQPSKIKPQGKSFLRDLLRLGDAQ